ncbi:MAG: virulence protein RhuM/Fic/DOC family protein [Ignavibacteriota bacterium]|nr:virulence protein RhuM/Fic/DOC family protein [Ignavibacteriales bacterium]MBL1123938.1 cytochrome C biogenesis protein CycH [Ignavibacteriota bacterium]MCC7095168.1 virulence protein RhuM/Fic/DOC family protein [Ignavibacteriaceae bacterium]MCE7857303.1 cytochrome C biogenesis protein CycH [Ignavibacteria bacterium CHB3]MEB2295281.1 virulence protein RhuM/Fic/DOC family protein [Ignavibacteria bacterium]
MKSKGEIKIYKSGRDVNLEVKLEEETVWLSLNQMCLLFGRDKSVVSRHLSNIFREKELEKNSVVANFATTAADGKLYQVDYYNLDVIISVGYRVKSKRGTQFRIWANKILKDYLVKGYALNKKRLTETKEKLNEVTENLKLLGKIVKQQKLTTDENLAFLNLISDYAFALDLLDKYDHQRIEDIKGKRKTLHKIELDEALSAISKFKKETRASDLFARPKDKSFDSTLTSIYQTFGGKEFYPSLEDKAANLLYFTVKNHSFIDGNKRIGAFLFIYFLNKNNFLLTEKGNQRISNETLVALTIMIAESNPKEKELIIKLIKHLLNNSSD